MRLAPLVQARGAGVRGQGPGVSLGWERRWPRAALGSPSLSPACSLGLCWRPSACCPLWGGLCYWGQEELK